MGDSDDSLFSFVVVAMLVVLTLPAHQAAYDDADTQLDVFDEPATVEAGNETQVNESSDRYGPNVTIETAKGRTLTEGTDYYWDASTGTISWLDSQATSDGQSVTVDYTYRSRTRGTENTWSLLSVLYGALGLFVFVSAVRTLLNYIGVIEREAPL